MHQSVGTEHKVRVARIYCMFYLYLCSQGGDALGENSLKKGNMVGSLPSFFFNKSVTFSQQIHVHVHVPVDSWYKA